MKNEQNNQKQQALDAIMNLISEYRNERDAMWKQRSDIVDTTSHLQVIKMKRLNKGITAAKDSINALLEAYERVRFL